MYICLYMKVKYLDGHKKKPNWAVGGQEWEGDFLLFVFFFNQVSVLTFQKLNTFKNF